MLGKAQTMLLETQLSQFPVMPAVDRKSMPAVDRKLTLTFIISRAHLHAYILE